ncbi:hypothetical protein TWF481_003955 [Arthrobotrys musiformis]|uniref:ABM domain-containing protein n=1 Tax=Arthrobotrys musiformis TaxID=47236 RepID=A0AAV9WI30_9PEZI
MVTTEICVFTLNEAVTKDLLLLPTGIHKSSLSTVLSQPGCQSIYWGLGIEDPKKLFWFIEWDSLSSHTRFQSLPSYPSFVASAATLTDPTAPTPISVLHYNLTPLSTLFPKSSPKPYLEYLNITTSSPPSLSTTLSSLAESLKTYGVTSTFALSIDEGKGDNAVSLVGWRDLPHHHAFWKTDAFKSTAPQMQALATAPLFFVHVDLLEWE